MKCEQCKGFKFFWGSEIKGYKGDPSDRLPCLRCCSVSIFKRDDFEHNSSGVEKTKSC